MAMVAGHQYEIAPPLDRFNASFLFRPLQSELYSMGKSLRDKCPRQSHADWKSLTTDPIPLRS